MNKRIVVLFLLENCVIFVCEESTEQLPNLNLITINSPNNNYASLCLFGAACTKQWQM